MYICFLAYASIDISTSGLPITFLNLGRGRCRFGILDRISFYVSIQGAKRNFKYQPGGSDHSAKEIIDAVAESSRVPTVIAVRPALGVSYESNAESKSDTSGLAKLK